MSSRRPSVRREPERVQSVRQLPSGGSIVEYVGVDGRTRIEIFTESGKSVNTMVSPPGQGLRYAEALERAVDVAMKTDGVKIAVGRRSFRAPANTISSDFAGAMVESIAMQETTKVVRDEIEKLAARLLEGTVVEGRPRECFHNNGIMLTRTGERIAMRAPKSHCACQSFK